MEDEPPERPLCEAAEKRSLPPALEGGSEAVSSEVTSFPLLLA